MGTIKLADLPAGSKIKFGKYQVNEEEAEMLTWIKGDNNHYKEGFCPFVTEYIIDLRPFDAKEINNINSGRQQYGNNDYQYSNIDQWLNKDNKNWFIQSHSTDAPPISENIYDPENEYASRPGFLYNFAPQEIELIEEVPVSVALPYFTGQTANQKVALNRKVFLLSNIELGLSSQSNIANDGTKWTIFNSNDNRKCKLSQQAFENSLSTMKPTTADSYGNYWTRTPETSWSYLVEGINSNGQSCSLSSFNGGYGGIRPILNLSSDLLILNNPDQDGYYSLYDSPWNNEWDYNETHHWRKCISGDCLSLPEDSEKKDYGLHIEDENWTIITVPTLYKDGLKGKLCTICGKVLETEIIPKNTSIYKLKDLPSGSKIKFGKYQVENEIPEVLTWIVGDNNHYLSGCRPMVTEYVIDLRCFDAKEASNSNSNRKNYGNNDYQYSNIDQWLNKNSKSWYSAAHSKDAAPSNANLYNYHGMRVTGYDDRPGFLYYFSPEEQEMLKFVYISCGLPYFEGEESNQSVTLTRKVFLLSAAELGGTPEGYVSDYGKKWSIFNENNNSRVKFLSSQAFNNSLVSNLSLDKGMVYFTRTPNSGYSYRSRAVAVDGALGIDYVAEATGGIVPVINLSSELDLMFSSDGYYMVNFSKWSENWSYNETYHWHECSAGVCLEVEDDSEKDGYGSHQFSEWTDIGGAEGAQKRTCTICGYEEIKGYKIKHLPLKSKIKFGNHKINAETVQPIIWQIVDKNHTGYPENSVTFLTEKIIDLRAFDAKEPSNSNSERASYGSNNYANSNINQWLNSKEANWFSATTSTDTAPDSTNTSNSTSYNNKPGFLYNFSNKEYSQILDTSLPVVDDTLSNNNVVNINTKVFLPSETELGYGTYIEGSKFAVTIADIKNGILTQQCFDNTLSTSKPSSITTTWNYWLRTPASGDGYRVKNTGTSTSNSGQNAYLGSIGIRPVLNLSQDIEVSYTPDEDGCYILNIFEWSEEWFNNSTHHWHECIGEECPPFENEAKNGYTPHTFGEWVTTKEPTETERGIRTKTCTVCGFSISEEIPSLSEKMTIIELTDSIKTRKPAVKLYLNTEIITEATEYEFKVEACNNGFDASPTWEDITQPVLNKRKCLLNNRTKTASDWGVKIRITLSKKVTASPIILNGLVFSY